MHPMVMFAIATQERDARTRENELVWRNARAARVPAAAVERDGRWAAAIARWARPEAEAAPAAPACDAAGCATA